MAVDDPTFNCGHPRTPANSYHTGRRDPDGSYRYSQCRFCRRVFDMCRVAEHRQDRLNRGLPVDGYSARIAIV